MADTTRSTRPDQTSMVHTLPPAPLVDRIEHLVRLAEGRRVVHVGFADSGYRDMQEGSGAWLHERLQGVATSLVGLDLDEAEVARAVADGYEALAVDCCDPQAVAATGLEPAPMVIAGEIIEHLDAPGHFLEAMHALVAPGGQLLLTTPNAYGWLNVAASLLRKEINHPDHVAMFTRRTLEALAARHGWAPVATWVYVPTVKSVVGTGVGARAAAGMARLVCGGERLAVRLGRPYAADGLMVSFRSVRPTSGRSSD
ncbi:MAG: methyltransferase domain-containing protein [Acidimicrobiia bacterium]|nr:methyltransferase domain-containing protein [Acidimicrobiia bacterium]